LTSAAGRFIQATLSDLVLAVSPTPEPAIKGFWVFLRLKNRAPWRNGKTGRRQEEYVIWQDQARTSSSSGKRSSNALKRRARKWPNGNNRRKITLRRKLKEIE
jgi:hypothetical protein